MTQPQPQQDAWRNRIVGGGEQSANQFLAHNLNARRHPAKQRDALRGSLNEVGWVAPVVVSQNSGKVLDGHARIEEQLSRDENGLIPFVSVDVTEDEERLILATFDAITGLATHDAEVLAELISGVTTEDDALRALIAEMVKSGSISDIANRAVTAYQMSYQICVECESEIEQRELLDKFTSEGLKCRALIL